MTRPINHRDESVQANLDLPIAQPSVHSLLFLQKSPVECSQCSIHRYFSLGSSCLPIFITQVVKLTDRICELSLRQVHIVYYYRFLTTSVINRRVKNYASGIVRFWETVSLGTRSLCLKDISCQWHGAASTMSIIEKWCFNQPIQL
jgi:hypothetical protein